MKKLLVVIMLVLSMLTAFVGTAGAAPKEAGFAQLTSAIYTAGGVHFTFKVSGDVSLKGSVSVQGGGNHSLYCVQGDEPDVVKCSAPKVVADHNLVVTFGGSQFWTFVPSHNWCYPLWDYDTYDVWKNYGPVCQDSPAHYGDVIEFYNPDWGYSYDYVFWYKEDWGCGTGIVGNAYYWDDCP